MAEDEFELDLSKHFHPPEASKSPELMMFYSTYGHGKTWLACSASEVEGLYPVLVIDNEGSTTGVIENFDRSRIDVIRPKDRWPGKEWSGVMQLLDGLLTKTHKYNTVIIDPLNTMFEWGKKAGTVPGDGYAHWNFVHEKFTADGGLISRLKDASFLAILVVHDKKEQGEGENAPVFSDFRWQGQGTALLGQYPDVVGYLTRDTNSAGVSKSTLFTAPTKKSNAKNRFGLPAKIEDPSMVKLYELINKKETK